MNPNNAIKFEKNINDNLTEACSQGDINEVKNLLNLGADIEYQNNLALMNAVRNNKLDVIKLLMKEGVNLSADNNRALHIATEHSYFDIVNFLILHGVDINSKRNITPLIRAANNGDLKLVKLFMEKNANFYENNCQVLVYCVENKEFIIFNYLLSIVQDFQKIFDNICLYQTKYIAEYKSLEYIKTSLNKLILKTNLEQNLSKKIITKQYKV